MTEMSISLFTGSSWVNDGTREHNLNPPKCLPPCFVYFQYPLSCRSRRKRLTNMAKKPSTDFLHKHWEKSTYQSKNRAGDPPCSFFNGMCVFHKYLICEIAADICLRARGGNMQTNCEILINPQTNMWEWDLADAKDWLCVYSESTER